MWAFQLSGVTAMAPATPLKPAFQLLDSCDWLLFNLTTQLFAATPAWLITFSVAQ
jgi:hypothetical protein